MFHPLLPDFSNLKETDLELKVAELTKKYTIAARIGDGGLCSQILLALEAYKSELQKRLAEKTKIAIKNQDQDLSNLININ